MKIVILFAAAVALAGCSQNTPAPKDAATEPASTTPARTASSKHTADPFAGYRKDEQKARNVENVLQKADDKRRKKLKEMGG